MIARMSDRSRLVRRVLAVALLLASAVSRGAQAQLSSTGTHGSAVAYGTADTADVSSIPGPDGLSVSMGAAATRSLGLSPALWLEDFTWDASVLGTGEVDYGVATAAVSLTASAKPEFTYATPLNQGNGPLANSGNAVADALLALEFDDTVTVTSSTLAAGTPVSLELHFAIASTDIIIGAGPDSFTGASFSGTVGSLTVGGSDLVRLVLGNQETVANFDTAVGHVLRIEGRLVADGEVHAGYRPCCAFTTEAETGTSVSSAGLWVSTPADVDLVAQSGTDYTQPVPEPGGLAAGAASLLAIGAWRRRGRTSRALSASGSSG